MKTSIFLFFILLIVLVSSISFSQNKDYEFSHGIYQTKIKTAVGDNDSNEKIIIETMMIYQVSNIKYSLCLMVDMEGWAFDIIKNTFSIDIDEETLKYQVDWEHISNNLTAFCFYLPADNLLKYNDSKKVILNIVLVKSDDDKYKEIPVKIDLKPEKTNVYLDFYNFSLKDNEIK